MALLLVAAGCSRDDEASQPSRTLDAAFDTPGLSSLDASPFSTGGATISGVVTDTAGVPLAAVPVSMCATACWPGVTDAAGRFHFPDLPIENYAVDIRGDRVANERLVSTIFPLQTHAGEQELAAPVRLYRANLDLAWDGAEQLNIGGLQLTPRQPLDLAELERFTGDATISGVAVPAFDWPLYDLRHDGMAYEARAMWALRPFAHALPAALELRSDARTDGSAVAGAGWFQVDVTTGEGEWLGPAASGGVAIDVLSWVILATPVITSGAT
jgi:hypothetical protein